MRMVVNSGFFIQQSMNFYFRFIFFFTIMTKVWMIMLFISFNHINGQQMELIAGHVVSRFFERKNTMIRFSR
jgi:hypothetical protein